MVNATSSAQLLRANSVVKFTKPIDNAFRKAHRQSNAPTFETCNGRAQPTVTHEKGGW